MPTVYSTVSFSMAMIPILRVGGEDFGALFSAEVERIFKDRLATFPSFTQDIFLSSRFEGMTYNEIAAKYGVSPRKIKREIQRVLADIRIALQDYLPLLG